ncbi:hypothetical protein [Deinococcus ruber]|uniref:Uncharacterized protein n=1 Tax=Deinococcus ruber TaxID=1848197 RepID=A0A918F5Z7_9DEIO|nr:hypothetical protein [Deinococcus ruber]GGR11359.1 hypothetical protein GCM10008957_25120 [Deinococcus ruber]
MHDDLLDVLLGCGCRKRCCCKQPVQEPPKPAGNLFQTAPRTLPPLRIPDDSPFVAPLYPERESPQLPQPNHAPALTHVLEHGEYTAVTAFGEAGFQTGILLDDGTIDSTSYAVIDHQARTYSSLHVTRQTDVHFGSGLGGANDTPLAMASGLFNSFGPLAAGLGTRTFTLEGQAPHAVDPVELLNQYVPFELRDVVGIGLCLVAPPYRERFGYTSEGTVSFTYTFTDTLEPTHLYAGGDLPAGSHTQTVNGAAPARQFQYLNEVLVDVLVKNVHEVQGVTQGDGQYTYLDRRPDVAALINYYVSSPSIGTLENCLLERRPMHITRQALNGSTLLSVERDVAGIVWHQASGIEPIQPYLGGALVLSGTVEHEGETVLQSGFAVTVATYYAQDAPPNPALYVPDRPFSVRSSVVQGKSFTVLHVDNTLSTWTASVNGAALPGTWTSWTAFEDAAGLTLVLGTDDGVTVLPGLDTAHARTATWAQLLADLRQPDGTVADYLGAHSGHHSFPGDRGYLHLSGTGGLRWIALGTWDAYRDVPADEWRAQQLSKPRTRAAFRAGQTHVPPAPTPTRPSHGLSLWDVYSLGGSVGTE